MGKDRKIVLVGILAVLVSGFVPSRLVAEEAEGPLWKGKEVELTVMMEYVSKLLDKRFIYDPDQLKNRKIAVLSTSRIPKESVYKIFHSIMRMNGFILVEYAEYVRVEQAANAKEVQTGVYSETEAAKFADQDRVITRIFQLQNANANNVSAIVKQLLQKDEQAVPLMESNSVVVTGSARNLERVAAVIEASDQAPPSTTSEYMELKHANAEDVAKQLQPLLKGLTAERQQKGGTPARLSTSQVIAVQRTNALILSGAQDELAELKKLIAELDVPGVKTRTEYLELKYAEAAAVARHLQPLVKASTTERGKPGPQSGLPALDISADPRTNGLVVAGTDEEIRTVRDLIAKLDVEVPTLKSTVKVFRVQNADAEDLVKTLQSVLAGEVVPESAGGPAGADGKAPLPVRTQQSEIDMIAQRGAIVVRAPAATLERIEALLKELDIRKPKVLIEAAIIELTVTKDFDIGVELATVDKPGGNIRGFGSTSVGISSLLDTNNDGIPDARVPLPGPGAIAGIFKNSYGDIPILIKALEQKTGLRVLAAPMVIADDNEEASFAASDQYPVATFSTTQSTTDVRTFGGFQEAKIQLKIKPNINEQEGYLRLNVEQLVEAFQGDPVAANLPPRKISREVKAVLTVPDGRTVAVGGLSNNRLQKTRSGVPFLQHIPLLGMAFRGDDKSDVQTRLYIFVNPKILKDLSFEDYQRLSDERKQKMDEFMKEQEKKDGKFWKKKEKETDEKGPGGAETTEEPRKTE
jgi:general secretion pathway protein D